MKLRFYLSCIFILFVSLTGYSQNPQWVSEFVGNNDCSVNAIAIDADKNLFAIGSFDGTVNFVAGNPSFTKTSTGQSDHYIAKMDSNGVMLWVNQFNNINNAGANNIEVDKSGNIYVSGWFFNTLDFDPGPGVGNLTALSQEGFLTKYDNNGNFLWAKLQPGVGSNDVPLAVDTAENVYVASNDINFTTLEKYSPTGALLWSKSFTSSYPSSTKALDFTSLHVDKFNTLIVGGYFRDTVDFDPDSSTFNLVSSINFDMFILKLDTLGSLIWIKSIQGDRYSHANAIDTDENGNIYIAGIFNGTYDFDPGIGIYSLSQNITSVQGHGFISRFDRSGNFNWVKKAFGSRNTGLDEMVYTQGNVHALGTFSTSIVAENSLLDRYRRNAIDGFDISLLTLDSSGIVKDVRAMGGKGNDYGTAMIKNTNGELYVAGYFYDSLDVNPTLSEFYLHSTTNKNAFITKIGQCTSTLPTTNDTVVACSYYVGKSGNTYNSTGVYFFKFGTINGCDSTNTLYLTINDDTTSSVVISSCGPFKSPSGKIWGTSGNQYRDTIPASYGCDSVIQFNLTVINLNPQVWQSGLDLKAGFTSTSFGYQWLDCNNNNAIIQGATTDTYRPIVNGNYALEVTFQGCTDTSTCFTYISVGKVELQLEKAFSIYPQPANEVVFIQSNTSNLIEEIRVLNAFGQLTKRFRPMNKNDSYSIKELNSGIYYLQIITKDKHVESYKLIKE